MLCQAELSRAIGLSGLMEMCRKKEYAVDKAAVSRAMDAGEPAAAVAALLQPALRDSLEALQEAKAGRAYSCPLSAPVQILSSCQTIALDAHFAVAASMTL